MKSKLIILIQFIIAMFITSCDFDDNLVEYEEQLVVFASINAGFPVSDTAVSYTHLTLPTRLMV